jgi:acyl dehydratase
VTVAPLGLLSARVAWCAIAIVHVGARLSARATVKAGAQLAHVYQLLTIYARIARQATALVHVNERLRADAIVDARLR